MIGEVFSVYVLDTKSKPTKTKAATPQTLLTDVSGCPLEDSRGHSGGLATTVVPDTIQHDHVLKHWKSLWIRKEAFRESFSLYKGQNQYRELFHVI